MTPSWRRPRGQDAQIAIALHCVGIDDDRIKPVHLVQPFRQRQRQC
jgi:hypothetical protein